MHLITDSNYLLRRAYHVKSLATLHNSSGIATGGVFGFLKGLHGALLKFQNVNKCTAVFDSKHSARRLAIHPEYKSNRKKTDLTEEELKERSSFIRQKMYLKYILSKLGCRVLEVPDTEADDVIYHLTRKLTGNKIVMSEDKDLFQTVSDTTSLYRPRADQLVTTENFEEYAKFPMSKFLLARALVGDPSDCIKGVRGVGVKTAASIVQFADTPEKVASSCASSTKKVLQRVSNCQATLEKNLLLIDLSLEQFSTEQLAFIDTVESNPVLIDLEKIVRFFSYMEFKSLTKHGDYTVWVSPFHMLG